jgi:hypothetical protein
MSQLVILVEQLQLRIASPLVRQSPWINSERYRSMQRECKEQSSKYSQNHIVVSQGSDLAVSWRSISTDLRNSESGVADLVQSTPVLTQTIPERL